MFSLCGTNKSRRWLKDRSFIFILLFTVLALAGSAQRVVVLGLDGFSSEGFNKAKHPNIDKLIAGGVFSLTTRPVMPSVTLPNWTSHLTGSGPEEHGVTSNAWTLQKHELSPVAADAEGYYPSIFKVVKEQVRGVKTAFFYNWAELINSMNKKYIDERAFQVNDGYDSNYNRACAFIIRNRRDPQLVFLYSVHTDHAGHQYGWMSPQYIAAIESADSAIGVFLKKLQEADLYKDTYFLLITDHGGINKGHGGTTMREMQVPWAITGPSVKKQGLKPFLNSNKNTALVLARIFKIKRVPESWTGVVPPGIFR